MAPSVCVNLLRMRWKIWFELYCSKYLVLKSINCSIHDSANTFVPCNIPILTPAHRYDYNTHYPNLQTRAIFQGLLMPCNRVYLYNLPSQAVRPQTPSNPASFSLSPYLIVIEPRRPDRLQRYTTPQVRCHSSIPFILQPSSSQNHFPQAASPPKHELHNPIQHHSSRHDHARQLQNGDLVPALRGPTQPARAPLQRLRERAEGLGRAVDQRVVLRRVVDVDRDAAQGRDFVREVVEARVVLSGWRRRPSQIGEGSGNERGEG